MFIGFFETIDNRVTAAYKNSNTVRHGEHIIKFVLARKKYVDDFFDLLAYNI